MKIIKPSVELLTTIDGQEVLKRIELAGRVCYKSEDKITDDSAEKFVRNIIKLGHESVLEHCSITLKFICDRAVANELVRHRIASYSQESSRYCNYSQDKFGNEITVIKPCFFEDINETKVITNITNPIEDKSTLNIQELGYRYWYVSCRTAELNYFNMLDLGFTPEEARDVLPLSLKTELVMTANLREWRHFFKLRCAKAAHPQMREVAIKALEIMKNVIPIVFDDIIPD